jgi:hypothetical protein
MHLRSSKGTKVNPDTFPTGASDGPFSLAIRGRQRSATGNIRCAYMLAIVQRNEDAQLRRREDATSTANCSKPKKTTRAITQSSPPNPTHRANSATGPTLSHAAASCVKSSLGQLIMRRHENVRLARARVMRRFVGVPIGTPTSEHVQDQAGPLQQPVVQ